MLERLKKWGTRKALLNLLHKGVTMTQLKIDRHTKTLEADLELEGETGPVHVQAAYAMEALPDGNRVVSLSNIHVSRPWLQVLARFALTGKKVPIPPQAAEFVALVM